MTARLYYVAAVPFESARSMANLPAGHRARNLHGHSFLARVRARLAQGWAPFAGAEVEALGERLTACLAPLDYGLLNDHLEVPTDENLAYWVRDRLDVPGIETVGIQSSRGQGVDLDRRGHAHRWRRFRFEAAHRLPNVAPGHPCGRMHGHGFEVVLHADSHLDDGDNGGDFDPLGAYWAPLHAELHYACLNDLPGLENPTSERLAGWIWQRLRPKLPPLSWVTVYETTTAGCHYDGADYRIWKEQGFESALRLVRAPQGDSRRRLHGHSYRVRLHLSAPLNPLLGWTVDYGDIKALFQPIYHALDHHRLDELADIPAADSANLLQWIRTAMAGRLPALDRIDLYQSPGCGAILCWGEKGAALPSG